MNDWVPLNINNNKLNEIIPNTYFVNIFGKVSKYNYETNMYEVQHQINAPTRACVGLWLKNGGIKQYTVKVLIMLTFSFRYDYEDHNIININKDLYDNSLNNLMWDDGTRFNKKIITVPIPYIETLPGEHWAHVMKMGYTSDISDNYMLFCSTFGRLYSYNKKVCILNPEISNGYYRLTIETNNIKNKRSTTHKFVHRIVMNTFKFNPNWESLQINHIDGNKLNNNIHNLEWVTPLQNTHHSRITGLNNSFGEMHPLSVYTETDVINVLDMYLNGYSLNQISYILNVQKSFICHVISGSLRVTETVKYMINHNYVPSKLFSADVLINIIKECGYYTNNRNFRAIYKKFNIKRNTPEYISIGIIYTIIYNCISWIEYINL